MLVKYKLVYMAWVDAIKESLKTMLVKYKY